MFNKDEVLNKTDFDVIGEDDNVVVNDPTWLEYKPIANFCNESTLYCDIINHYHEQLRYDSLMTVAHETCHMIHSDLRQKHNNRPCLYTGANKYIVLENPKFTKDKIAQFVPNNLYGSRYQTYVVGARDWNDYPCYILDEAQAYITGASVGVELVESGKFRGGTTDYIFSLIEFAVYSLALVYTIDKYDKDFYTRCPEFLKYIDWMLRRSKYIYDKGSIMKEFTWQGMDQYLSNFRSSVFKDMLRTRFGGIWL